MSVMMMFYLNGPLRCKFVCSIVFLLLGFIANPSFGQIPSLSDAHLHNYRAHNSYVRLAEAPGPVYQVSSFALRPRVGWPDTTFLTIYNVLVPATTVQQLAPGLLRAPEAVTQLGDTLLLTLTVLPDTDGRFRWQPIRLDTVPVERRLNWVALARDAEMRFRAQRQAGNPGTHVLMARSDIFPVIRRQGQDYVPSSEVLVQYFRVHTRPTATLRHTDYFTLNIAGPRLDQDAPFRTVLALHPPSGYDHPSLAPAIGLVRSGTFRGITEFWSRVRDITSHPWMGEYGLQEFTYKPGIGVLTAQLQFFLSEYRGFSLYNGGQPPSKIYWQSSIPVNIRTQR